MSNVKFGTTALSASFKTCIIPIDIQPLMNFHDLYILHIEYKICIDIYLCTYEPT